MTHSRIVPLDIDKRYRWAIVECARNIAGLPESLAREFEELLESPNASPGGSQESIDTLGSELEPTLARTRKIVEGLSFFLDGKPTTDRTSGLGFIKWLGASGWGNDLRLIRLFGKWADEAERRKTIKRMKINASPQAVQ